MNEPLKGALSTLSKQSGVVSEALKAPVFPGDLAPIKSIMDLHNNATALRPTAEEGWRLHPRLREYLFDHLQHYPAYQSLSDIGAHVNSLRALWSQAVELKSVSGYESIVDIIDRMQDTVYDIVDNMMRNLRHLDNLLSTSYGNVKTLAEKKNQNSWYRKETDRLTYHLGVLTHSSAEIERSATDQHLHDFAKFLRTNLLSHLLTWQQGLAEIQGRLTLEIYQTREVDKHHRQLSRLDMLMRQQPSWKGVDVDLDSEIPDFLLAARLPDIEAHIEPEDPDTDVQAMLVEASKSLPPLQRAKPPEEKKQYKKKEPTSDPTPVSPEMLASERLIQHVMESADGVSLVDWRLGDPDAMTMEPDLWLIFSMQFLRMAEVKVVLIPDPPRVGERFSHTFSDAIASGPNRAYLQ